MSAGGRERRRRRSRELTLIRQDTPGGGTAEGIGSHEYINAAEVMNSN